MMLFIIKIIINHHNHHFHHDQQFWNLIWDFSACTVFSNQVPKLSIMMEMMIEDNFDYACSDQYKRCSFSGISQYSTRERSCWSGQMAPIAWPPPTHCSSPFLFFYIFHFHKPARPRQRQPSARDKLMMASLGNYYIKFGR